MCESTGWWPWKSESTNECVTTHQPNQLALKMDGNRASGLYQTVDVMRGALQSAADDASTSRQVAAVSIEALGASPGGAAAVADLGGSSKYSNENSED